MTPFVSGPFLTNPFRQEDVENWFEEQKGKLMDDIRSTPEKAILNDDLEVLAFEVSEKFEPDIPTIDHDPNNWKEEYDGGESGRHALKIGFSGNARIFAYHPRSTGFHYPIGSVTKDYILITMDFRTDSSEDIVKAFQQEVSKYQSGLNKLKNDFKDYSNQLFKLAKKELLARKSRIDRKNKIAKGLPWKLKKRPDAEEVIEVPVKRKNVLSKTIPKNKKINVNVPTPQPAISDDVYKDILNTISIMSRVMERCPDAFRDLDEESLRFYFLALLSAKFEISATGETFNYTGQTDIILHWKASPIFIAECKFWNGPKSFNKCIDQIRGYLTWRDTKTAIILFVRDQDITSVIPKAKDILESHKCFLKVQSSKDPSIFGALMRHEEKDLTFKMTILVFKVPGKSPKL